MGDFVGGMLKYVRTHPVPRVTIAGGIGKMTKLAQGLLDLHSREARSISARLPRSPSRRAASPELAERIRASNTAAEAFAHAEAEGIALGDEVARAGWRHRRADGRVKRSQASHRDRDCGIRP